MHHKLSVVLSAEERFLPVPFQPSPLVLSLPTFFTEIQHPRVIEIQQKTFAEMESGAEVQRVPQCLCDGAEPEAISERHESLLLATQPCANGTSCPVG